MDEVAWIRIAKLLEKLDPPPSHVLENILEVWLCGLSLLDSLYDGLIFVPFDKSSFVSWSCQLTSYCGYYNIPEIIGEASLFSELAAIV